jgi:hypothetical protein
MVKVSLKEFIINGHFGNVHLGMSENKVLSELGVPEEGGDYGDQGYSFFYGQYEFFFDKESKVLNGIQNDWLVTDNQEERIDIIGFKNDHFFIDTWILDNRRNSEFHEILSHIISEGISHRIEENDFETIIHFQSGAYLDFTDQDSWIEVETISRDVEDGTIQNRQQYLLNGIRIFQ